jgi:hypothetical protein
MSDLHQKKKPDPPGGVDFVVQSIDAHFDCSSGSMLTMTNLHGPNLSSPMISSYSITDATSSQNNNSNNGDSNDNNEILTVDLISTSTNDPDVPCSTYLDNHDNALLLSIGFPNHSLVLNHIQQYSFSRGFMTSHHAKDHTISQLMTIKNTSLDKVILERQKIQIQNQPEEEYFIVPPNPTVTPSMNLVRLPMLDL